MLSFLGQLPLGTMSITATQISVQENFSNAWKYALGVALVEMIYVWLVLSGLLWIMKHRLFFTVVNWLTVVFFLGLGTWSFIAAQKQDADKKALLLNNGLNRFFLGIGMSALNPAQIPFWFIWSGYFIDAGWLSTDFASFNFFTVGCGLGTLLGLALYMYGGNFLVTKMKTSNRTLNKIMGVIFILAACAQLYRLLKT
ncbi:MAG: LysE family transporter [Bacteroidota bacterium]|nr:LysE family transporter [Bacteroidota bacterium]MDP4212128.1 LysE family transporter [Bacteroidota bacterium]